MKNLILLALGLVVSVGSLAQSQAFDGIDVSHHQGVIDWQTVAKNHKNIKYVYIKATTGVTGVDKQYKYNNEQARKYGLKVGAYHYFTSGGSAHQQFKHFTQIAPREQQDLIPMVDVEAYLDKWTKKQVQDSLKVFMQLCKEYYGSYPMIYGTQRSYNTYCAPVFNRYHLMIGRYSTNKPVIIGTAEYSIWQFSETGQLKGIKKLVDLSRLNEKYDVSILYLRSTY